jgi:hypothetical protein
VSVAVDLWSLVLMGVGLLMLVLLVGCLICGVGCCTSAAGVGAVGLWSVMLDVLVGGMA